MAASGRLKFFEKTLNQDGLFPYLSQKEVLALSALPDSDFMRDAAEQLKLSDRKWGDGLFVDDSGKFIVTETHFIYLVNQTQHNRQNALNIEGKTEIAKLIHSHRLWVKVPHPQGLCFERDERVSELARFSMDQVFFLTSKNKKYSYNISNHTFIEVKDFLCGGFKGETLYGHSEVSESSHEADVLKLCENNQLKWMTRGDKRWPDTIDESNWLDVPNPLNNEEIIIKLCSMKEKHYFYTSDNRVFSLNNHFFFTPIPIPEQTNRIIDMALTSENIYLLCDNGLFSSTSMGFVQVQVDLYDGEQIISLSTSLYHAFFITNQNRIFCTGRNDLGQLGLGDKIHRTELTEVLLNLKPGQKIYGVTCGTEFTILHTNQGNIISGHLFNSEKSRFDDRHQPTFPSNNPVPLSQLEISLFLLGFIASIAAIVVPFLVGIIFSSTPLIVISLMISPISILIMFHLWHSMQFRNHFSLHPLVLDAINNEENCIDGKDDQIRIYPVFSTGPSW